MLNKKTSHELNEMFNDAYEKIESLNCAINSVKQDIYDKMKVTKYENDYINKKIDEIKEYADGAKQTTFLFSDDIKSVSDYCGICHTGKIENEINTFNIIVPTTSEAFYRDIADVSVNGSANEKYSCLLKHDYCSDKKIFIYETIDDSIEIDIEMNELKNLGFNIINCVEFDMLIAGSYTIEALDIYNNYDEDPCYSLSEPIENAGKFKLMLDKEYSFKKAHIKIKSNYKTTNNNTMIHPFVIQHIYFNKVSIKNDSYGIIKIESKDKYIDYIDNIITVVTPSGNYDSSIEQKHILLYLNCDMDGKLSVQQEQSETYANSISKNIKTIYAKVPLLNNESIIGIKFNIGTN